jgi:RHS repeat-associated protein
VEDTAANDHALLETYSYNGLGYRVLQTITPAGATAGAAAGAVAGTTAYYYSNQWQVLEERVDGATAANIQNVWSPVYVNALVCQDSLALGQSGVLGNPGTGQAQRLFIQQDANYNVTAVLALQTLPGDTNLDGTVNFTDYSTLIQHWQETVTGGAGVGDFNYDGKVDFNDYSILVQNWQATASLTWQVVQRVAYDPDGKQTVLTGNWSATPYPAFVLQGFQGGLKDQITGNINFDFRDYNPATMTWNTQDPLVFVDGMNRYEPEGNNPITEVDPNGTWKIEGGNIVVVKGDLPGPIAQALLGSSQRWRELFPSVPDDRHLRPGRYPIPSTLAPASRTPVKPTPVPNRHPPDVVTNGWTKEEPKCDNVGPIDWTGTWSLSQYAAITGRAQADFEFTGTDAKGRIYRIKGQGWSTFVSCGSAAIGIGYFSHTFKVTADDPTWAPIWPMKKGDMIAEMTMGAGGAILVPISISKTTSACGEWFSQDEWFSTGGGNVFVGGTGINVRVDTIEYQVH